MKEKVECQQLPVKDLVCIMLISHCVEFIDMVATPSLQEILGNIVFACGTYVHLKLRRFDS